MNKQNITKLGFGLMRLPTQTNGDIDKKQVAEMVDIALENGITYFDTAYFYHNKQSENVTGEVLSKRKNRQDFILADKMPMSIIENYNHAEEIFEEQLKKCGVDYFDNYLLHALNKNFFQKVKDFDIMKLIEQKKSEGKIKKIGFSFHDTAPVLQEIIQYYKWDFVQLQLNYYDLAKEDYKNQYEIATQNNLPIIVMEPIRGGFLARVVPKAQEIIKNTYGENKEAALALSYVNSLPNVIMILSGMSDIAQLKDNINTFKNPIKIDSKAKLVIENILDEIKNFKAIECTNCEYCLPCPAGLEIPKIFDINNNYQTFRSTFDTKNQLSKLTTQPKDCVSCNKCEVKCPQNLPISKYMQQFAKEIDSFG